MILKCVGKNKNISLTLLEAILICIGNYAKDILGASRWDACQMMVACFTERSCLQHVTYNPIGIYAR